MDYLADHQNVFVGFFFFKLTVVADPGGARGYGPPPPVLWKKVIKKMAAEGGHIDFMFLGPHPYPATGSATGPSPSLREC